MIAALVVAVGWALIVLALTILFGVWVLVGAGAVMILVGLFIDLEPNGDTPNG